MEISERLNNDSLFHNKHWYNTRPKPLNTPKLHQIYHWVSCERCWNVWVCEYVSMWVMTDGPYKSVNLAKSPFKTPAWKAPTFPPSGGDTILGLIPWVWWKLIHSQSCLPNMGPKAHPPPLGGPLFIWNPLNLNTFEYLCFNEVNNLICILSSKGQNIAIYEGYIEESQKNPYKNMTIA